MLVLPSLYLGGAQERQDGGKLRALLLGRDGLDTHARRGTRQKSSTNRAGTVGTAHQHLSFACFFCARCLWSVCIWRNVGRFRWFLGAERSFSQELLSKAGVYFCLDTIAAATAPYPLEAFMEGFCVMFCAPRKDSGVYRCGLAQISPHKPEAHITGCGKRPSFYVYFYLVLF